MIASIIHLIYISTYNYIHEKRQTSAGFFWLTVFRLLLCLTAFLKAFGDQNGL